MLTTNKMHGILKKYFFAKLDKIMRSNIHNMHTCGFKNKIVFSLSGKYVQSNICLHNTYWFQQKLFLVSLKLSQWSNSHLSFIIIIQYHRRRNRSGRSGHGRYTIQLELNGNGRHTTGFVYRACATNLQLLILTRN